MTSISAQLDDVRARIGKAKLIAVSKTRSVEDIRHALRAGQRSFGENRVQEAYNKFPSLRIQYPDLELHLIGPLQTNKAQDAVELFDVIQTLDRRALADALTKAIHKTGRAPRLYIEVNIGNEAQKSGIAPDQLDSFLHYCREECGLSITGLMCIPPQNQDPRSFFEDMRKHADRLHLQHLSIGMSDDYHIALLCGATEVRVGTAIFGPRTA